MNNTVPLENSIPSNCCSALFKNLVRGCGCKCPQTVWLTLPREAVGGPERKLSTSFALSHSPAFSPSQLLKKIKRCERKGTESVTEEKCAVLFSTSFTLGPNKLLIQLQVSADHASPDAAGDPLLLTPPEPWTPPPVCLITHSGCFWDNWQRWEEQDLEGHI